MTTQEAIARELDYIERVNKVRILYACEAGSRAWGFSSRNSDFDVRFVYLRPMREYLSLLDRRDTLDWRVSARDNALGADLDGHGWDLRKFLRLMRSSNPSVYDWLGSPIVYREDPRWNLVRREARDCFQPRKSVYHHLGVCGTEIKLIGNGHASAKAYCYLVRSVLSAKWTLLRRTPAPLEVTKLMDAVLEPRMRPVVERLLAEKAQTNEITRIQRISALDEWVDESMTDIRASVSGVESTEKASFDALDDIFMQFLGL